jgi:HNH endonuclease
LTRLIARLIPEGDCLVWSGAKFTNGYGQINIKGRPRPVHRIVYEGLVGPIPKGLFVLHKCDNKVCCNKDHLFLGTLSDNMKDMMSKGRGRKQFGSHER